MPRFSAAVNSIFDRLETYWEGENIRRRVALLLVAAFLLALAVIELQRQDLLPEAFKEAIPRNHFYAVGLAFTLLLIVEVIGLVFSLVRSVADSVGKQLEILSLILLRDSFKELVHFDEPIRWTDVNEPVLHILSDSTGALLIFVALGFYYRIQKHRPITKSRDQQTRFITAKKSLALLLVLVFAAVGAHNLWGHLTGRAIYDFFSIFYTILIFGDILLVLISLRYSPNYFVLFRNSGFALTTVVIRLALTAPPYVNAALGVGAALFAIGLTLAYNTFTTEE